MKINVTKLCDTPGCQEECYGNHAFCVDCLVEADLQDTYDRFSMLPNEYSEYKEHERQLVPEPYRVSVRFPNKYNVIGI